LINVDFLKFNLYLNSVHNNNSKCTERCLVWRWTQPLNRPTYLRIDTETFYLVSISCIMYYVSRIMYHVSCITYHVSCITYHVLRITYHVLRIMYYVSCITYHLSCITYHVSRIMYYELSFNFFYNNETFILCRKMQKQT